MTVNKPALAPYQNVFLTLLRASLREEGPEEGREKPVLTLSEEEWNALHLLASRHQVTALVYDALGRYTAAGLMDAQRSVLRMQALITCTQTLEKDRRLAECLEGMQRDGCRPVLVKGLVCRSLYPKPELRPSTDEDLIIQEAALKGLLKSLQNKGFQTLGKLPEDQLPEEVGVFHRGLGLYLELHTRLFPEDSALNRRFNKLLDPQLSRTRPLVCQGIRAEALNDTGHLLYLYCHFLKHFLHGGTGIRQLCDIVLTAEKREAFIDWPLLKRQLDQLEIRTFVENLMEIGRLYLGFRCPSWDRYFERPKEDVLPLLADILDAGVFGASTKERKHSANMTLNAMARGRAEGQSQDVLHALFPSAAYMQKQFPQLKDRPWLLLPAYGIRILRYLRGRRKRTGEKSGLTLGRERIGLMQRYGLLGQEKQRMVETAPYIEMLLTVTETGKTVSLSVAGTSMIPFLAGGRDRVLFKKPDRQLRVGDIILFRRDNGQYVLHRICRIKDGNYYAVGDAQTFIEGPIRPDQICGLVTMAERKGRFVKPEDPLWRFFEKIWIRVIPARPLVQRTYLTLSRLVKGLKRK